MKIYIAGWWMITLYASFATPSDPPEIPETEPEGIPVEPPETIPQPDKGPFSPDEPEQIPPLPIPEHPSPGPVNPGQPTMRCAPPPCYSEPG